MSVITFVPSGKTIEVPSGVTLYEAALRGGLQVAAWCGGEATCGKCNMRVGAGEENLSSREEIEGRLLKKEGRPATDRISCVTRVLGDCSVTTSYW